MWSCTEPTSVPCLLGGQHGDDRLGLVGGVRGRLGHRRVLRAAEEAGVGCGSGVREGGRCASGWSGPRYGRAHSRRHTHAQQDTRTHTSSTQPTLGLSPFRHTPDIPTTHIRKPSRAHTRRHTARLTTSPITGLSLSLLDHTYRHTQTHTDTQTHSQTLCQPLYLLASPYTRTLTHAHARTHLRKVSADAADSVGVNVVEDEALPGLGQVARHALAHLPQADERNRRGRCG